VFPDKEKDPKLVISIWSMMTLQTPNKQAQKDLVWQSLVPGPGLSSARYVIALCVALHNRIRGPISNFRCPTKAPAMGGWTKQAYQTGPRTLWPVLYGLCCTACVVRPMLYDLCCTPVGSTDLSISQQSLKAHPCSSVIRPNLSPSVKRKQFGGQNATGVCGQIISYHLSRGTSKL
jgi:hypothetical protein